MKELIFRVESPNGKLLCHEWLDEESWHNDYYSPLLENGVVSDQDVNVELVRKQYVGLNDINGAKIFDGMVVNFDLFLVSTGRVQWHDSDSFTGWGIVHGNNNLIHLSRKFIRKNKVTIAHK